MLSFEREPLAWYNFHMKDRDKLIVDNMRMVHFLAWKMYSKNPDCQNEDLASAGFEGLIKAADSWDKDTGCKFSTYAYNSIRWAMLRYIYSVSPYTANDYTRHKDTLPEVTHVPIDGNYEPANEDERYASFENGVDTMSLLECLDERERLCVMMRMEDVSLRKIGQELGLTAERVRQIYNKSMRKIRRAVGHDLWNHRLNL